MDWNVTSQSRGRLAAFMAASILAVLTLRPSALAETLPQEAALPVVLEANDVGYDQKQSIVIARGNVEIMQGDYLLRADRVIYYQNKNLVTAEGNISMMQPSGDVAFAEKVELKDDLKTGVIKNFSARMADNSVFAAREAKRLNPYQIRLKKAAYTPCNLCKGENPFWQIKSSKIFVNDADEKVTHQNARLEMKGVPVFFSPYLSHPTPDAGAKSGFLVPEYQAGANLGTVVKAPYYWRMAPNREAIITPWYTNDEGPLLQVNYDQLNDGGRFTTEISGTNPRRLGPDGIPTTGNQFRGHIYAKADQEFAPYWRGGFNLARATDDTYLRRYGFGDQNALFSNVFVEGAKRRNYGLVNGLAIQGLRQGDNSKTTPLVLPTIEGYYETDPYASGLKLHSFLNTQSITRDTGVDQQRLSLTLGGDLPYISESGHVLKLTGNLRGDVYQVNNEPINDNTELFDGTVTRAIPQGALEWRYPLIRQISDASLVVEPLMLGVAQPYSGNNDKISNEDNNLLELTDTNLFSLNRMTGLDTIDTGPRLAYGLRSQYLETDNKSIELLLGQNYSFDAATPFPNSTTPGEHLSDYIGRVALDYRQVGVSYLFGLDPSSMQLHRSEVGMDFSYQWLSLSATYLSIDQNQYLAKSQETYGSANIRLYGGWSIFGGARQDVLTSQLLAANGGALYQNECFDIRFEMLRNNTRDRDIEPATTYALRVGFKNLGAFGATQ